MSLWPGNRGSCNPGELYLQIRTVCGCPLLILISCSSLTTWAWGASATKPRIVALCLLTVGFFHAGRRRAGQPLLAVSECETSPYAIIFHSSHFHFPAALHSKTNLFLFLLFWVFPGWFRYLLPERAKLAGGLTHRNCSSPNCLLFIFASFSKQTLTFSFKADSREWIV